MPFGAQCCLTVWHCVCAHPQVFEHLPNPFAAASALHGLLKPGGVLLWTAPFTQRHHAMPGDYFRYTPQGALSAFEQAGFQVRAPRVRPCV